MSSWRLAFHSTKLLFSYTVPFKMKLFRDSIITGDVTKLRELSDGRPRLLQQSIDADGNTALGLALLLGEVDIVRTLLQLGSDANVANAFDGNHPLVILAKLRVEENSKTPLLAELLLDAGSDPLHEVRYQVDNAKRLDATQTPSFHETPLLCCIRFQNEILLRKMIEKEININSLNPETGTSPLMLAAALGYLNICNILIDAGAEVNASDHTGNTPLHLAVQGYGDKAPVVKLLILRGADINATNEDGFTPAMIAKNMDNDECCKLLESKINDPVEPPPQYPEPTNTTVENADENIFDLT
ncbi:unnamed protein product [Rotaria socialis]|uniref:Uncharacterized protein n=1 Tax=Rotaria socialis TaxID=392032 RepID=A0A821IAW2_9BILA|nr:unnamed protein product [Rotaria socialis]CAF4698480.1 unnamed protein product [Rotaria socialis]